MSCRPPAPVCRLIVDPVGSGYVVSMARPGGNATGFTSIEMSLIPKARACRDQWGRGVKGAIRSLARWSPRPHHRLCKNKKLKASGSREKFMWTPFLFLCAALLLTTGGASAQGSTGPGGKPIPKLVLFMVVDG